jgi:hypothetical protein
MSSISNIITNNKGLIVAILLLASISGAYAINDNGKTITFVDPDCPDTRYMVLYPNGTFEIYQPTENLTGTYTEYPDKYGLKYDQGFGQEAIKTKNGIKSPVGNEWIKV